MLSSLTPRVHLADGYFRRDVEFSWRIFPSYLLFSKLGLPPSARLYVPTEMPLSRTLGVKGDGRREKKKNGERERERERETTSPQHGLSTLNINVAPVLPTPLEFHTLWVHTLGESIVISNHNNFMIKTFFYSKETLFFNPCSVGVRQRSLWSSHSRKPRQIFPLTSQNSKFFFF